MSYLQRISRDFQKESLTRDELAYYARHLLLPGIGAKGQLKLKCARALVVGAGGLGCPALQGLAGAGVGHLGIIDGDTVAQSNLSRQWLHRHADAGLNKAESAARTLRALNPFIEIHAYPEQLGTETAEGLLPDFDLVVDATDNQEVRRCIDTICAAHDIPWVHAALYRDHSQLTVFWDCCGARYTALHPEDSEALSCAGAGMLGAAASLVGNLQALEAIKLITASESPRIGEVVHLDSGKLALRAFQIPGVRTPRALPDPDATSPLAVTTEELEQARSIHAPFTLVDIRSTSERGARPLPGAVPCSAESILESDLPEDLKRAPEVILLCQEGLVSSLLAQALHARGLENVRFLEDGANALDEGG